MPNDDNGNPTPEKILAIQQYAVQDEAAAKNAQNYKNLPLPAQVYERYKRYVDEGDEMGASIMLKEIQNLKSKELSHTDHTLLNDALVRFRQASAKLQDYRTQMVGKGNPALLQTITDAKDAAERDVQKYITHQSTEAGNPTMTVPAPAAAAPAPATSTNRVIDFDQSGQLDFQKP